jgi:mannose-6-phosphate isomerase-like protein (cupin superfamily)
MKIYRAKEAKQEQKDGFLLGTLAELNLQNNPSSVGFFRPSIPPNGHLRNHYHEDLVEFMFFLNPARIKCGSETFDIESGDLVMFNRGDQHEVFVGPEGDIPFVIKLPNNPKDTKVPK